MTKYSDLWDGNKDKVDFIIKGLENKVCEIKEGLTQEEVRAIVCETLSKFIVISLFETVAAHIIKDAE